LTATALQASDIAATIRGYIRSRYGIPDSDGDFSDDVHLFEYGYVDSFGAMELTLFVETQFDVKISESDMVLYLLNTVNQIAAFVIKRRTGQI
jgi:acyl carrier protein